MAQIDKGLIVMFYPVKFCPSTSQSQFNEATKIARLKLDDFCTSTEKYRHFSGKILILSTMARSGAAALCQILHCAGERDNKLLVYSTPDVFSTLAIFADDFSNMGLEKFRRVLLATTRYFCKDQLNDQTIVIKLRFNCTRLVPHFHAVAPSIMHIYMARDKMDDALKLYMNTPKNHSDFLKLAVILRTSNSLLCDWLTTICIQEKYMVNLIRPKNILELTLSLIGRSTIDYKKNRKYYAMPVIYYETLVTEMISTVNSIFDACGLQNMSIPDVLECKKSLELKAAENECEQFAIEDKIVINKIAQLIGVYADY